MKKAITFIIIIGIFASLLSGCFKRFYYGSNGKVNGDNNHINLDNLTQSIANTNILSNNASALSNVSAVTLSASKTNETITLPYTQSVIFKSQEKFGYFAWPSVTSLGGSRLIAVASGYRESHRCPYGKEVGWISEDNGATWGEPFVIADTPLDDRDAGVIYWKGKIIVTWFTAPVRNYASGSSAWKDYCSKITREQEAKNLGANFTVSEDGGRTWSDPKLIPVFTPHGMIEGPNGELVYVGYSHYSSEQGKFTKIGMITSTDGVNWSDVKVIADTSVKDRYGFDEPHAVFAADGTLIVQLRTTNDGIYQCESKDYGKTFTEYHRVCEAGDTPPNLLKLNDGTLVLTYGCRTAPFGIRTKLSYDNGVTWTSERIITTDGFELDMGYADTVVLSNGKLLTVYYQRQYTSDQHPGIMQIIWDVPAKPINKTMTISFDSLGGSNVNAISGKFGTKATKPADPIRKGYSFSGWHTDSKCIQKYTFSIFSDDTTLYAKWVERPIPQAKNKKYIREATNAELSNAGYKGGGDAYMYTKPVGESANDGSKAEMWIDSDSSKGNTLSFSFYIQDWLTKKDVSVEIDSVQKSYFKHRCLSVINQSNGSALTPSKGKNGFNISMQPKTWYTVTVDMTDVDKMNIFCAKSNGMNAIISDIALSTSSAGHKWADATCTNPMTCSVCKLTSGEAKGHTWVKKDGKYVCSECGATKNKGDNNTDITRNSGFLVTVLVVSTIAFLGAGIVIFILHKKKRKVKNTRL